MASADRLIEVFDEAKARPAGAERERFVAEACRVEPALEAQVLALLQAHEGAGDFLKHTHLISPAALLTEKPGDRIGRYKLLQQIGEGGCGVVYMAEQEEPVRRRVALKVIKLGMDTKSVIARFEAERQALALMDHPSIAKVFDAGATEAGRPYFVMELVRGIKITDYCDQNNLSTEDRLKLFTQVCQAIQHAHQKGIIHRDIKPSNILVTISEPGAPGCPKVIDFGIAKATTGQRLTDKTVFTAFEQFIGTPAYMSPEQAMMTGLDIDTRTDIYALGVLLYELLTGQTPFDANELMAAGLDAMRRIIREQEPARPSTRLSTLLVADLTIVARHRHAEPGRLGTLLRGDLDWIVMKALEKDRTRRYETANGLAADIQRHLSNEPVVARPPSNLYRFQKMVRRNKLAFAAAAAISTVLVLGVVVSTWQAIRATRAEREAVRAGNVARHQEQLARESADEARRQRGLASEQELLARRRFYAAQMNLANQAVEAGQPGRALELLETQRPKAAAEDLRAFEWYHLWGLCNARLRGTLRGHKEPVNSVAISPDGKTLASASEDSTIRLWETSTGQQGITLESPPGKPVFYAVAFTPDGKTVAAGNSDGLVPLWDMASGKIRATLPFQHGWVRALAISPEGKYLVCGGDEGLIKLFDLATKAEQTTLSAHQGPVLCLAFSPDGSKIASASGWGLDGGKVKLWDLTHGLIQPKLQVNESAWTLAFSPDGKRLAIAAWDKIYIGDTATGQLQATLTGHSPRVRSLAWLPDGKALVSCASDRTVRLWPMPPTNSVLTENQIIGEHLDAATCLAISAGGTTLASGANDGSVKLWNVTPTREQAEAQVAGYFQIGTGSGNGQLVSLCFSPDGSSLVGGMERLIAAKDIVSGQDHPALSGAAGRGALSPDGKLLATGDSAGTVKLWDLASRRLLATIKAHTAVGFSSEGVRLAFSPDGRMLATCGFEDPVLKAWDPAAGLKLLWGTDTKSGISALAFSPDGKTIAAAVRHAHVNSFDASTGQQNQNYSFEVERGEAGVRSLALSPDGKFLATGSDSGAAKLWSLATGRLHAALPGHAGMVNAVAFSPDGGTIVTGSEDQTVRLWDVASGQERMTLKGFRSGVTAVAFSPDGNTLAAGSIDRLVRLWRAKRDLEGFAPADLQDDEHARLLRTKAEVLAQATAMRNLAEALEGQGKWTEAETLHREALVSWRKREGSGGFETSYTLHKLGNALAAQGKWSEAENVYREELALRRKQAGNDDPETLYALRNLAGTLEGQGKWAEAETLHREALASWRKRAGSDDPQTLYTLDRLGWTLEGQSKWSEAENVYRETLASRRTGAGNEAPQTLSEIESLTRVLMRQKKFVETEQLLEEALTLAIVRQPSSCNLLAQRVELMGHQGRWQGAAPTATLVVEYQPTDQFRYHTLAALLAITRDRPAYETFCRKILATFTNTTDPYIDERIAKDCLLLPDSGVDLKFVDELADKAVSLGSGYPDAMPYFQAAKAMSAYRLGHFGESIEWAQKTVKSSIIYPNAHAYAILAMAHWELGHKDVARAMLDKGDSLTPNILPSHQPVDLGDSWVAWLQARILLDEATALIQPASKTESNSQKP